MEALGHAEETTALRRELNESGKPFDHRWHKIALLTASSEVFG